MTMFGPASLRERLFWLCLAVYVVVLPMSSTMALRSLAFAGLIAATLWKLAKHDSRPYFPAGRAWLAYVAVALLSLASALDVRYSLGQIRSEIVYGGSVFAIAATFLGQADRLRKLAWIVAAGNTLMLAGSFYLIAVTPDAASTAIGSIRAATGTYSTYLVTVSPLLLHLAWCAWQAKDRRTLALVGLLVAANLVALFFTANRLGLLAYATEIAVVGTFAIRRDFNWRAAATLAGAVLAVVALFAAQHHKRYDMMPDDAPEEIRATSTVEGDVRWGLWQFTVDEIARRPWQGAGFGRRAFQKAYPEYQRTHPMLWHAHNMVLNKGVQMGLPGIAAFLLLWLALGAAVVRAAARGADTGLVACTAALLVGVFLKNMTDDFFVEDNALMFWLLCGALLSALRADAAERR